MARRTKVEAEAYRRGKDAGQSQASWFDFDEDSAVRFLQGYEDGDPEIMDAYSPRGPLSGEYAGESIVELLGDLIDDRADALPDADVEDVTEPIYAAYEEGFELGFWDTLQRRAKKYAPRRRNPPLPGRIQGLEREAGRACRARGHKMGKWRFLDNRRGFAVCKECGMEVVVNLRPAANEIDIGGEAVALTCPGKTYAENPRKNVEQVMEAFSRKRSKGHPGDSIWTNGDDVYSYNTCLLTRVQRTGTVFLLNGTRYSVTTTIQQNGIRTILRQHDAAVVEVEGLSRGASADDLLAQAGWSDD